LSNWRTGICLQQIFSDFPKHLKLIRWTGAFMSFALCWSLASARAEFGTDLLPTLVCSVWLPTPRYTRWWELPHKSSCLCTPAKCADAGLWGSVTPVLLGPECKAMPTGSGCHHCQSSCTPCLDLCDQGSALTTRLAVPTGATWLCLCLLFTFPVVTWNSGSLAKEVGHLRATGTHAIVKNAEVI
jgi:hypothetical protein